MTCSQQYTSSINAVNSTLQQKYDALKSTVFRTMEEGEMVVRFFGMKDIDGLLTSYNIFSSMKFSFSFKFNINIKQPKYGNTLSHQN